jgi:hypothetical protein
MNEILTSTVESPIGPLTLIARDGVLTNLTMHEQRHMSPPPVTRRSRDDAWFKDVAAQLDAYFAGELSTFDLEMNAARHTLFKQTCVDPVVRDSLWRDNLVRRVGTSRRQRQCVARRRSRQRPKPDRPHRSLSPRDRRQRFAHRLWRWHRA